jgi:hypothetical protein
MTGFLALEDGTVFRGESVGAEGFAFGEAVFSRSSASRLRWSATTASMRTAASHAVRTHARS